MVNNVNANIKARKWRGHSYALNLRGRPRIGTPTHK